MQFLEMEMEDFELSSRLGIGNGEVRVKFQSLKSGMEEFEQSSMFGIGNGGVREKFLRVRVRVGVRYILTKVTTAT